MTGKFALVCLIVAMCLKNNAIQIYLFDFHITYPIKQLYK